MIFVVEDQADTLVVKRLDHPPAAIGRAVVDHDQLEVAERLGEDALDGLTDIGLMIVAVEDNGDGGGHRAGPR